MQDNYSEEEFDKAFIQESWKTLRRELDSHMPIIVPRSRKIAYLLGLTQLISLGVIAFLLHQSNNQIPYTKLTKTETVTEKVYIQLPGEIETKTITKYLTGPTEYVYINQNQTSSTKKSIVLTEATNNTKRIENLASLQNFHFNNYLISHRNLNTLPKVGFPLLQTQRVAENDDFKDLIQKNVDFRIGLLASVSNDLDFSGYGISTSFQVAINDKLSIGSGFGYNHLSREFVLTPFFPKSRLSYDIDVSNEDLSLESTFYNGLQDLKQIFIPLSINYNLSDKFSLSSGLKFRYTFDSTVNKNLKSELLNSLRSVIDPETLFFNKTNFGLSLGLNYAVSEKVAFQLDSEFGINSLINGNQFKNNGTTHDLNLINFTTQFSF
jgi:hypothetical protein